MDQKSGQENMAVKRGDRCGEVAFSGGSTVIAKRNRDTIRDQLSLSVCSGLMRTSDILARNPRVPSVITVPTIDEMGSLKEVDIMLGYTTRKTQNWTLLNHIIIFGKQMLFYNR